MSSYLYKMSVVPKKTPKHLVNDWKCMESNIVGLDFVIIYDMHFHFTDFHFKKQIRFYLLELK